MWDLMISIDFRFERDGGGRGRGWRGGLRGIGGGLRRLGGGGRGSVDWTEGGMRLVAGFGVSGMICASRLMVGASWHVRGRDRTLEDDFTRQNCRSHEQNYHSALLGESTPRAASLLIYTCVHASIRQHHVIYAITAIPVTVSLVLSESNPWGGVVNMLPTLHQSVSSKRSLCSNAKTEIEIHLLVHHFH